jgi:hypothetical protein
MFSYEEHKYIKGKVLREVSVKVCRFPLHCPPMQGYSLNWGEGGDYPYHVERGNIIQHKRIKKDRRTIQPDLLQLSHDACYTYMVYGLSPVGLYYKVLTYESTEHTDKNGKEMFFFLGTFPSI